MPSPFAPDDADLFLADFGEDLVCVAVPAVTRGLIDDDVADRDLHGGRTTVQLTTLKVKRGAFGDTKVSDTRVTIVSRNQEYVIVGPIPRRTSLFDYYELRPVKSRSAP